MMTFLSRGIRKYPVLLFFLLSYSISWVSWLFSPWLLDRYQPLLRDDIPIITVGDIPLILRVLFVIASITGAFGPAIAAIVLTACLDGKEGLRNLFAKVFRYRVGPGLLVAALLIPVVVQFISPVGVGLAFGSSFPDFSKYGLIAVLGLLLEFLLIHGGQEELGFRGFAQERLQNKLGLINTGVIMGVFWFFWHLPLYLWISSASQFGDNLLLSLAHQIAVCFVFTWVYSRTRSILMAMLLHAVINFMASFASVDLASNSSAIAALVVRIFVFAAIGIFLIWRYGSKQSESTQTKLNADKWKWYSTSHD